jgi:NAD(P)-dependent dehydrogenase (short-subunit alcohol dehydrogenase family)
MATNGMENIDSTQRDLASLVAVVTGAGSGVGRATAVALAEAGATPVLIGRTREPLEETAALVLETGGRSVVIPADVTAEAAIITVFAEAEAVLGGIDAVILAAGIGRNGSIESYSLADWEATIATNLTGPFLCAKAAIPHLRRRGGGHIIAISSGAGKQAMPNLAPTAPRNLA